MTSLQKYKHVRDAQSKRELFVISAEKKMRFLALFIESVIEQNYNL